MIDMWHEANVTIRLENGAKPEERAIIRIINEAAFGGTEEADLVDKLRAEGHALVSVVAELENQIVGHIMFSRMWIETADGPVPAVALAPVAVLPECQHRNIGGRLIRAGLDMLRDRGETIVILVGHPDYYPRFGFSSEKAQALESPFPRDAFMALELTSGSLAGVRGKVKYPAPFGI